MTEATKHHIAEMALGILEEQVQARIVHYKAELETNPELDAITAQVVAQLKEMQGQALAAQSGHTVDRAVVKEAHRKTLQALLEKVFKPGAVSPVLERRLRDIHKKLARLFFQSELHDKTRAKDGSTGSKVIHHAEQALFYLLVRYDHRMKNELGGFDFVDQEMKDRSFELLQKIVKDMQDAFLARRSGELKRTVAAFHTMLLEFLVKTMPAAAPDLAREVIDQAGTSEGRALAYKIREDAFVRFRTTFERRLMVRLVSVAEDALVRNLADTAGEAVREETVLFISDPRIFSMICGELCDGVYDFLCSEGFLDVPADWRNAAAANEA